MTDRATALAVLAEAPSLRAAAAQTGVPKSTLWRWSQEAIATPEPGGPVLPVPQPTEQDREVIDIEAGYHAGADDNFQAPSFADRLTDPYFLRAVHRYANLVQRGTRGDLALHAARVIDPYFSLTDTEDVALRSAVERFTGGESELAFFAAVPFYVNQIAKQYHFDDAATNALLDSIAQLRTDGWIAGINANLAGLGRPLIEDITDPALLRRIQLESADVANSIAATWNADASTAAWNAYKSLDANLSPAEQQAAVEDAMAQWRDDRMQWKADQIDLDQATTGMFDATKEFQDQNGTAEVGWVEPQDAECDACQEACDLGDESDPVDADTLLSLDLPLHRGCPHGVVLVQRDDIPDDQSLWDGQSGA
jgi:hypothetical protein